MVGGVDWVLNRVPFDKVWDPVNKWAFLKYLTESLFAQIAQADKQMDQNTSRNVFFEKVEQSSHDVGKHPGVPFEGVQDLVAVQDIGK